MTARISIDFAKDDSASKLFYRLLKGTAQRFANSLNFNPPSTRDIFKKDYGEVLANFETARLASVDRHKIAAVMSSALLEELIVDSESKIDLSSYMLKDKGYLLKNPSFTLEARQFSPSQIYNYNMNYAAKHYSLNEVCDLARLMLKTKKLTSAANRALRKTSESFNLTENTLDLKGERFVLLGAAAELAPTQLLLSAGADVLWLDRQSPDFSSLPTEKFSGKLTYVKDGVDLLTQTREIAALIYQYITNGDAAHIGLFAYAGGRGREVRLTAAMNSIVEALPNDRLKSVATYVSPTSIAVMQPEDEEASTAAQKKLKAWQLVCQKIGSLKKPMIFKQSGFALARAIVPLQGISYQLAQYVGKNLSAEALQEYGSFYPKTDGNKQTKPSISVNVAGITKTRSLNHPIFQAAFVGAPKFDVDIFEVETTNTLAGLLMLHDCIVQPNQDSDQLFSKQIHGGIYSAGYALDPMIKIATLLGLASKPRLLTGLVKAR